jgi:putative polymerase
VVAPALPRYSAAIYFPAVLGLAFALVHFEGFTAGPDDFAGRIAHTIELLKAFTVTEWLGFSEDPVLLSRAVDSGVGYLIMTQSIVVLAILWLFIVFGPVERSPDQIRFSHATAIYLSLNMMVSFALLTIKTAALLWLIYGALQANRRSVERGARVADRNSSAFARLAHGPQRQSQPGF